MRPLLDEGPQRCNTFFFSTSHVIPHIRALVPSPGATSEVCVVASTSVPLTPTEILSISIGRLGLREVSGFTVHLLLTYKKKSHNF